MLPRYCRSHNICILERLKYKLHALVIQKKGPSIWTILYLLKFFHCLLYFRNIHGLYNLPHRFRYLPAQQYQDLRVEFGCSAVPHLTWPIDVVTFCVFIAISNLAAIAS